jgi:hypothetical protein
LTTPELDLPVGSKAAKTPAQRLVELQGQIAALERDLLIEQAKAVKAEDALARFTRIGGVSYGGVPISQSWAELVLWEGLLNDRRYEAVIELGTWQGGFAWWMAGQAKARGMMFHTFDSIAPQRDLPDECFTRMDIFIEREKLIQLIHEWEPLILFCDNGNKPRELVEFATALQHPYSLAVVHDWGTEVQPEDVPDSLEMMYGNFCEEIGSMNRVFKRRADDS